MPKKYQAKIFQLIVTPFCRTYVNCSLIDRSGIFCCCRPSFLRRWHVACSKIVFHMFWLQQVVTWATAAFVSSWNGLLILFWHEQVLLLLIFRKLSFQVCLWVKIRACQQILKYPAQTVLHQQRHHISVILMTEVCFSNLSFPGLHRSYALSICHVISTFCISKKIELLYLMKWPNDGLGRPWKRDRWVFPFGLLQLGPSLRWNEWIDRLLYFYFP